MMHGWGYRIAHCEVRVYLLSQGVMTRTPTDTREPPKQTENTIHTSQTIRQEQEMITHRIPPIQVRAGYS